MGALKEPPGSVLAGGGEGDELACLSPPEAVIPHPAIVKFHIPVPGLLISRLRLGQLQGPLRGALVCLFGPEAIFPSPKPNDQKVRSVCNRTRSLKKALAI